MPAPDAVRPNPTAPPPEKVLGHSTSNSKPSASTSTSTPSTSSIDDTTLSPRADEVLDTDTASLSAAHAKEKELDGRAPRSDGRIELRESDGYDALGYAFSERRKWTILAVIFAVQCSMNFNASVYPNAVPLLAEEFSISEQAARVGQMIFLVAYAFGCELWAPWSEEFGRWPTLQLSLFLVNVWQILCTFAPNYGSIVVGRFLGGISSAGGSVTLAMVADMWEPEVQQYPVAFVVFSSVGGSVLGPIFGGFLQRYAHWRWNFGTQFIFGAAVQIAHFFLVPETRSSVLLDREAKRLRKKEGKTNVYGPNELKENRLTVKELLIIWSRPFEMFFREPIVLCLSLLSGFSDALIFIFLESYGPVFAQWDFSIIATNLAFCAIAIGYVIAYASYVYPFERFKKKYHRDPDSYKPEDRLWWLLFTAPLEPIGLAGFAATSLGPPRVHWIAPLIFSSLVGIANYTIYMSTIDYMIAAYGPYSASATGGNGFARDFLAGIAALYATPMYDALGLEWATGLLSIVAVFVAIPVYVFYRYGPEIRARSKFAQTLASERTESKKRRARTATEKDLLGKA